MKLTKTQRITFFNELEKCNEEIDIAKSIISKAADRIKESEANGMIKAEVTKKTIESSMFLYSFL